VDIQEVVFQVILEVEYLVIQELQVSQDLVALQVNQEQAELENQDFLAIQELQVSKELLLI
jgi:hypothetical protein